MRFIDVVDLLIGTYNAIDIRTVAFDANGRWQSIFNIIRFRIESIEEIKKEHKKIEKYDLISNEKFRVELCAFPTENWAKICSNFTNSVMQLPNFLVNISEDNLNQEVSESPECADLDERNKDWKGFYLITRTPTLKHDQTILTNQNGEALQRSFKNIYDYLGAIFEIKTSSVNWNVSTNVVVAPVFFNIENVMFDDKTVTVNGKWCPNISVKLMLDLYHVDSNNQRGKLKDKIPLPLKATTESKTIESFTIMETIPNMSPRDAFEIVPTCNNVLLQHYGGWIEYKLQKKSLEQNDPLIKVFEKFITLKELKDMLINIKSKDIRDPKIIFERGVYWLLTILGFQTIWLGKGFEQLEKMPHVVIDMIASYQNYVLLVNATSGILESKDITGQAFNKEEISKEISNETIQIYPILFSPRSVNELRASVGEDNVRLIGKDELQYIFQLLENQKIDQARSYLFTKPWRASSLNPYGI